MRRIYLLLCLLIPLVSCKKLTHSDLSRDQVFKKTLSNIRLGDGVPLGIELSVRWKITNKKKFLAQFPDTKTYDSLVLEPRERELINKIANSFPSVDSVFKKDRKRFIERMKDVLAEDLGETGIEIKEVIVSDIIFPKTFTQSMEKVGLKERELEAIRLQNISDREQAKARELKAQADGKATIEAAKVDGEIAKMNARIEREKRLAKLAEAETEAKVMEIKAKSEARKLKILADRAIEEKRDLNNLALENSTKTNNLNLDYDTKVAEVYAKNPVYTNFLVNKELASKVHIAVIPPGTNVNGLLQQVTIDTKPKKEIISNELVEEPKYEEEEEEY